VSETRVPSQDGRDGHYALGLKSEDVAQWIRQHAREHGFELDAAQNDALRYIERLYEDLAGLERLEASLIRMFAKRRIVRGIYLWGGVGRGKSFLMDSFLNCAPVTRKVRLHFHRFMQDIHRRMKLLQGQPEPLAAIARDIARDCRLICLDEFQVADITDAMLMRRLLEGMFAEGVVLVTTSNLHPDELYLHGLQRSQFLPAIDLIKQNMEIVEVNGGIDYRLRELVKAGIYHREADAEERLEEAFLGIARHGSAGPRALDVDGHVVTAKRLARGLAWFEFEELCGGPRGKADYIELARNFHTVLLSGVPQFTAGEADKLRRFIWLVDEFYDRRVKLIVAAKVAPEALCERVENDARFQRVVGPVEFDRIVSRLTEMQTRDYLAQPHLP